MSNVLTSAERVPHDLSHFVYSTGSLGRLKVLSTVPVLAGDSFELNYVGAFRLSPLRRGLAIDSNVDFFTFYIPHRHSYGQEFVDMLKAGIPKTGTPVLLSTDTAQAPTDEYPDPTGFLGTHVNPQTLKLPKYFYQSYLRIYNNYFKNPYDPDVTVALDAMDPANLQDGIVCSHLESFWTKPLNPNDQTTSTYNVPVNGANGGLDIIGLNQAYGKLHTQQERDNFMSRYREVVGSFGGSTHYDADNRPHLLMRSNFWASGYDVDGTSQETIGQFSGRVQQPFHHQVPRFYVPEHGVMMTLALVRMPPVVQNECHYLASKATLDYTDIAGDPALIGNAPPRTVNSALIFARRGYKGYDFKVPEGQWLRFMPHYVDNRYTAVQGFPFLSNIPDNVHNATKCNSHDYDTMFQTNQLGQWNIQSKMNVNVYRRLPSARDSIMTN